MSSTTLEAVIAQAMTLAPDERAELIETLADTVMPSPALHPGWQAEIEKRVSDMDAGRTTFVAADDALAVLASRIKRRIRAAS